MSDSKSLQGPSRAVVAAFAGVVGGFVLALAVLAGPFDLLGRHGSESHDAAAESESESGLWTCGMHPNVVQNEKGICPICQMDLVALHVDDGEPSAATFDDPHAGHDHAPDAEVWSCSMHPMIEEDTPGSCSICGMDLELQETAGSPVSEEGVAVRIDPAVVQNMNVRTAFVERRDLSRPIRTVGYLDYDQERMVTVTTKYTGWVEKVYVNYVGEPVQEGQPLFEVYSPELVQTEQELLSALDFARDMGEAPDDSQSRASALVDAARTRLGYWDIEPQQITELEKTRQVFRTLKVVSPAKGLVMKRMAGLEGMAVTPGMEIFHIADLSSLWLSVEIFENQVTWVREGTPAEITLPYFPGQPFRGTVRFLEPEFSEKTRTLRVKIEVPNSTGELRKGMFATVVFDPVAVAGAVAAPTQAVLRTGRRNVVVVAMGAGRFVPREVVIGHEAEGFTEILRGVEVGEELVTSAQFLLDSESKLREAIQKMIAAGGGAQEVNQHSGHAH